MKEFGSKMCLVPRIEILALKLTTIEVNVVHSLAEREGGVKVASRRKFKFMCNSVEVVRPLTEEEGNRFPNLYNRQL